MSPEALERASGNLAAHLGNIGEGPKAWRALADAAFTLQTGRSELCTGG
jgi:acyl transferase domain-containing protein